jgi:hypothetical protein
VTGRRWKEGALLAWVILATGASLAQLYRPASAVLLRLLGKG